MAIFRAGPWGNLSDSYQPVPTNTAAEGLTLYPVNCAKTNWLSGQAWGAYYEVTESGCCTPETITISGIPAGYYPTNLTRNEVSCEYFETSSGSFGFDYYTISVTSFGSGWTLYWNSAFAFGTATLINNDACDPTGTYTDDYNGYTYTISTP